MFKTVKELFEAKAPELVPFLENEGAFWPVAKNNTVTLGDLNGIIYAGSCIPDARGNVYNAAVLLKEARNNGEIENPE